MSSTNTTRRRRDVTGGATSQPTEEQRDSRSWTDYINALCHEDIEDPSSELVWFYVQLVAGGLLDLTWLPKDQPLYPPSQLLCKNAAEAAVVQTVKNSRRNFQGIPFY